MPDREFYHDRRSSQRREGRVKRVHPYSRPEPRQNRRRYERSTFDLPVRDLSELMQCQTVAVFRRTNKRTIYKQERLPKPGCRFANYNFKRSVQNKEMCEYRQSSHSKSVVETSNITVITGTSSANASAACSSLESGNGNKSPAVIHKTQDAGSSIEPYDMVDLTISDASSPGTSSDNGMEAGTEARDCYLSTVKESDLISYFGDFDSVGDFDQNLVDSHTVGNVILTTEDHAAATGGIVNHVPSQHLDVLGDVEFSTSDITEFMPTQTQGPHLNPERNDSCVSDNAHVAVSTVSSDLIFACKDQLASSVSNLRFAHMPTWDMENGCDSSPEEVLNITADQYSIVPPDSHLYDCEITEGTLSESTSLTAQPAHCQLDLPQAFVVAEHCSYPGSPLAWPSSANTDLKEECRSSHVTLPAVSADCSPPAGLTYADTPQHDSEFTPGVDSVSDRDHVGKHKAQLTILKQLISKVQYLQVQMSQNAKSESLLKAVKYLKERSKNFTALWTTKGKMISSVLSASKLRHKKHGAPVQPQESCRATNSVTKTQPNSARVRLTDAQPLPPQEDGELKLLMTQQKELGREQKNKAGHRQREPCGGVDKSLHAHKTERHHQPETGTQDPTHLEYAVDSDIGLCAECTIDSSRNRRHLKLSRKYNKQRKKKHKSEKFKQNVLSPMMTQTQQLDIGISSEQTHAVSSKKSNEPFSCKNNQLSFESLEIKEKSQVMSCGSSVAWNELSDKMSHVMVEPDSLVATNRGIMPEPTQIMNRSCPQASSEKVQPRDPSVVTSSKILVVTGSNMLGVPTQEASIKCGQSRLVMTSHEISEPPKATDIHKLLKSECSMDMLHEPVSVTEHKIPRSFSEKNASKMSLASLSENTAINIKETERDVAGSVMPYTLSQGVTSEDLPGHLDTAVSKIVNCDETTISKKSDRNVSNSMVGLVPYWELYLRVNSQPELHKVTVLKSHSTSQGYTKDTEYHEFQDTPVKDISDQATSNVIRKIDQLQMFAHFPQSASYGLSTSQNSSGIPIDALKLSTGGVSYESLTNDSTNDTLNVAKTLATGEHNVSEFQKEHTIRSSNVKCTQSNASNLITCCQEQPVLIPGDLIGAELSRIRKQMELAGQNKLSQRVNTHLHKPCRKCAVSSVKHVCSKGISYSKNNNQKDYSKPANLLKSPEFYEGVCSLSETSAHRRSQPCRKIPVYVSERTQFRPNLGDTSCHVASNDQSVADCLKPIQDDLCEDSHGLVGHQSQKPPLRCLNTSQLHSPAGSAHKPPLQQLKQLDVDVSLGHDSELAYSHVQTECLPDLSTLLDLSCNDMEVTDDCFHVGNSASQLDLSCNDMEVTDNCFHVGNSAPQHVQTIRSHLTSEEHMMKAEVLLDCLIKEICHDVKRSPQNVVSRQHYSEAEQCTEDSFSLQESSSYKSNTAGEYYHDGDCPPRKTKNVRSYSTCREHTRKTQAFHDDPDKVIGHDTSWSPLKVNKKHHTKSRTTKHGAYGMLKSSSDEDNIANSQFGESSLRKLKCGGAYSENKYSRKAKTLHNDPFEATFHDLAWSAVKMNKKKHNKKKSKRASYDIRKSTHDADNATNDHYNTPGNREQSSNTRSIRSCSVSRTHFRKTTPLLDSPIDKSCRDTRWSPVKVHKKRHKGKKSKRGSCDTLQSIPDTDDHYRYHEKKSKRGSCDTLQSIPDTDDHYRYHEKKSKRGSCDTLQSIPDTDDHYRYHEKKSKRGSCDTLQSIPDTNDHYRHHGKKSKRGSCDTLQSIPDTDDHYRYHEKKSKRGSCDTLQSIPDTDDHYRYHEKKSKRGSCDTLQSIPDTDDHYRYEKKSKHGSCDTLQSIPDTDDHYRHRGKKLKRGSCDTLQSIPDTDDHYRHHGKKLKRGSCDTLKSIPDTDDHYRHHGKKLKRGSCDTLKSIPDTYGHYRHHGNCSRRARKNTRTYSSYKEHVREGTALFDYSAEYTCHDIRWLSVKVDKRQHHGEKSQPWSWGKLESIPDTDMATHDHDYPDKSSYPATEDIAFDSAQREHLRKAQALLNFPSSTSGHDNRWLKLKVNPEKHYQKKSKPGSCGILKSIPDADIATHDHNHPGSCTPPPTHERAEDIMEPL